jgi:hypothetical protein
MSRGVLNESVEGNRVVAVNGETVGVVERVDDDIAYVDIDPDLSEDLQARLGCLAHERRYPVRAPAIERITNDEVHLGGRT